MPVPDDFDFDHWAETVKLKTKPSEASALQEFQEVVFGEDPSVISPEASLEITLDLMDGERKRSEKLAHLREFAIRVWDAAEEAGYQEVAKCCGCSGSDKELNPFKERRARDE